jgi:hypothetical protein
MKLFLAAPLLLLFACGTPGGKAANAQAQDSLRAAARLDSLHQDSLRDGHHHIMGPNGRTTMEGDMRRGKRHGVWTSYTTTGRTKSRSEYIEGVLQGPTITFHDNGAVYYKGQYRKGKRFGEWSFFDEQGEPIRTVAFDSLGVEVVPK